jgi:hypothetical protein
MKYTNHAAAVLAMTLAAAPLCLRAQMPDGSDISKAIPIYFGQDVHDIIDAGLKQNQVYSITLGRGQQFIVTANKTSANGDWFMAIYSPSTLSIGSASNAQKLAVTGNGFSNSSQSYALSYQVPAAGVYYVLVQAASPGINYTLQVSAQGTPIGVPLPAQAGCLTGGVDYITYSLQLIAMDLPDAVSVGGTQMCAACPVKPPLYSQIVHKLELALRAGLNAQVCYDATGNVFQVTLRNP